MRQQLWTPIAMPHHRANRDQRHIAAIGVLVAMTFTGGRIPAAFRPLGIGPPTWDGENLAVNWKVGAATTAAADLP